MMMKFISFLKDQNVVVLLNKTDLSMVTTPEMVKERLHKPVVCISARMETGIDELCRSVGIHVLSGKVSFNEEVYLTNARQKRAMEEAGESLKSTGEHFPWNAGRFYSIDLMDAYESLGSITGESVGEDLVNEIFSKFCMGK